MTKLKAAPVRKQPSQATKRLRFQFMGSDTGAMGYRNSRRRAWRWRSGQGKKLACSVCAFDARTSNAFRADWQQLK
ncbi:hypothetical protein [Serratia sp. FGI94]|uniref:hypothetical protein n=1 Tax=Serratia sp. FGI94 TaxID=671990 RepID=UPI0018F71A26|nr:hypothetical protein [Serratia sp. FGI94]